MTVDASSGNSGDSIPKIESEFEALLSHTMDEDNHIDFLFDVWIAQTSDAGIEPTSQTRLSGYAAAGMLHLSYILFSLILMEYGTV